MTHLLSFHSQRSVTRDRAYGRNGTVLSVEAVSRMMLLVPRSLRPCSASGRNEKSRIFRGFLAWILGRRKAKNRREVPKCSTDEENVGEFSC